MSWLISRALMEAYANSPSSPELVAEFSADTCSAGAPSAPLSVMPTQHKFWRNDKTMEPSQLSRFGLTCAVLTESHGEDLLTWFLADSRVRTYQLPGMAQGSTGPGLGSGVKWRESSAKYDLQSSTWKTHLCLWEEDLPWSSVTLPKWGMTRSGALFQHPMLERPISATVAGLWPTITVCGNYNQPGSSKNAGWGLSSAVKKWPTPVASMAKGSSPASLTRKSGADRSNDRLDHAVMASDGGQLNPEWVEWLMGWPIGWTELKPLEMDRFQEWQRQHSISCNPAKSEPA